MKILNLTPHPIVIRPADGEDVTIPPSGQVARVAASYEAAGDVDGIPAVRRVLGQAEGLPAPQPDTVYIVSAMVLSAIAGREDVVAPDTGPTAIRDDAGRIVAVTRLIRP